MLRHLLLALGAGVGFYVLTSSITPYDNFQLGEIALYAVALAGLSVLTGINGQISLGHGALMAVGAYTVALLMTHTQLNFVVELLVAVAVTAVMGIVVGIPATRLKGPYLAGMTLILAVGLPLLADKYSSVFGGDQGLSTTPPSAPGSINSQEWLTWIEIVGALITLVLLANLLRSRFGRSFRAVRDDEIAASLAGIHVARTKVIAFTLSAGCAGLAGAFLGVSTGVVNTGEFPLHAVHRDPRRHGPRRCGDSHRSVVGRDSSRLSAQLVHLLLERVQARERRERLHGDDRLRGRPDRRHASRSVGYPRRSQTGVDPGSNRALGLARR